MEEREGGRRQRVGGKDGRRVGGGMEEREVGWEGEMGFAGHCLGSAGGYNIYICNYIPATAGRG